MARRLPRCRESVGTTTRLTNFGDDCNLRFDSRLRQSNLLLSALSSETADRTSVANRSTDSCTKSPVSAGIQSALFGDTAAVVESTGSMLGNAGTGTTPVPKADPTTPHPSPEIKYSDATCQPLTRTDFSRIHPKMGSTLESRGRVGAAGKPSDEPLRKGETQSLEVLGNIAAVPHLHHTLITPNYHWNGDRKIVWPGPLRNMRKLGLLPSVKKLQIYRRNSCYDFLVFSPKLLYCFNRRHFLR